MPRQSHSGRGIAPWHRCDRCGFDFRVTELRRQLGLIVCTACTDNTIAWLRPNLIQDKLNASVEQELRVADILKETGSDDVDSLS
jgi:hypothetical protein